MDLGAFDADTDADHDIDSDVDVCIDDGHANHYYSSLTT